MNFIPIRLLLRPLLIFGLSFAAIWWTPVFPQINAIVYFKDTTQVGGHITFVSSADRSGVEFFSPKTNETQMLDPGAVRYFRLSEKEGKDNKVRFFYSLRLNNSRESFFEKLTEGRNILFKSVDNGAYFLQTEKGELLKIPNDRKQRKTFYNDLFLDAVRVVSYAAFDYKLTEFNHLTDYLDYRPRKFPSNYSGVKGVYGLQTISDPEVAPENMPLLGPNREFHSSIAGLSFFKNTALSARGNFNIDFEIGFRHRMVDDYQESAGKIHIFSVRSVSGIGAIALRHSWNRGSFFPFLGVGVGGSLILKEVGKSVLFSPVNNNYQEQIANFQLFSNSFVLPSLKAGLEIPVNKYHYLIMESATGLEWNKIIRGQIMYEFSIGINLR